MEITGNIKVIQETTGTTKAGKQWSKKTMVLTTDGDYPQSIPVDFLNDKTAILENFSEGDRVKVGINLRGSEYNNKYYVSLNGWKVAFDNEVTNTEQNQAREEIPF